MNKDFNDNNVQNTEVKTSFIDRIKNLTKKQKITAISTSCVLIAAIACGIVFGVINSKNNTVETKKTSSSASSSENEYGEIPEIEDNSSDSASNDSASADATVADNSAENNNTASTAVSSEATTTSQATTSKKSTNTTGKANTAATQNNNTVNQTQAIQPAANTWKCPDPSAHGDSDGTHCLSAEQHARLISKYQAYLAEQATSSVKDISQCTPNGWILISSDDKDKPENKDGNHCYGSVATGTIVWYYYDTSSGSWKAYN